ncbi:MAG: response regulator [Spirochaetes bacterium]|nr:response regulator [Spirochaetota bacterium]
MAGRVMKKNKPEKNESVADNLKLREQADRLLNGKPVEGENLTKLLPKDFNFLIHELQVHQIELQMQKEELQRVQNELEKARDRITDLYDFSPAGYITVNDKGLIKEANLKIADMLGVEREFLIGKPFTRFIQKDFQDVFYKHRKLVLEMLNHSICDLKLKKKDGAEFHSRLEILVVKEGDDRPAELRITITDISELKLAEEAILKAKDELEERVQERTIQLRALVLTLTQTEQRERRKLAEVLHDNLQQLLVGAKWGIQLALQKNQNNEADLALKRTAEFIDESIKTSKSLALELAPPILYDAGLVAGVKWLSRRMEEKYGLVVDINADLEIEPDTDGIGIMLFRIIQELLFNVSKHSGVKKAAVYISIKNGHVEIEVSDRGSGFDSATLMYNSIDSGFGLFSIRERLAFLGGKITISSSPDVGTCVSILAPLKAPDMNKNKPGNDLLQTHTEIIHRIISTGNKIRVLVADDHKIVREGLCGLLGSVPEIEVIGEANDGKEAVAMTKELLPEIVVMDVNMPKMNGIEATKLIMSAMPDVKVIALSMHEEADLADSMKSAGAVDFIHKAGASQDLIASILNHVGRIRQKKQFI